MQPDRTSSAAQCCDKVYFCPTAGETECPVHGGFDVCCDRPDLHRPVPSAAKIGPAFMSAERREDLRRAVAGARLRDQLVVVTPDELDALLNAYELRERNRATPAEAKSSEGHGMTAATPSPRRAV